MLMRNDDCPKHGITMHYNRKCGKCLDIEADKEKARWDALSVEEKIEELKHAIERLAMRGRKIC